MNYQNPHKLEIQQADLVSKKLPAFQAHGSSSKFTRKGSDLVLALAMILC